MQKIIKNNNSLVPWVSIILPVFNGQKYLARAVQSVLDQDFDNWELLIIDDGSIDTTPQIAKILSEKDSRIRYLQNSQNMGIQKTLNRGLREAKGKYIARIDDDDYWIDSTKLTQQVGFLDANPEHVLVGTGVVLKNEEGQELLRYLVPQNDEQIRNKLLAKNCFIHSSVMFNRGAVLKVGGYSEEKKWLHVEDYVLWLRLGLQGKLANLAIFSVAYTVRTDSISGLNKMVQFMSNIKLAKVYRTEYPNYSSAQIRSWARLVIYGFLSPLAPASVIMFLRKIYQRY